MSCHACQDQLVLSKTLLSRVILMKLGPAYSLGSCGLDDLHDAIDVEVAFPRSRWSNAHRLVGHLNMELLEIRSSSTVILLLLSRSINDMKIRKMWGQGSKSQPGGQQLVHTTQPAG